MLHGLLTGVDDKPPGVETCVVDRTSGRAYVVAAYSSDDSNAGEVEPSPSRVTRGRAHGTSEEDCLFCFFVLFPLLLWPVKMGEGMGWIHVITTPWAGSLALALALSSSRDLD